MIVRVYADSVAHDLRYATCRCIAADAESGEVIRVLEREHIDEEPGELLERTMEQLTAELEAEGYLIL